MTDTGKHWPRINALLEQALDQPPSERDCFVRAQAGDDQDLAQQVLELLALEDSGALSPTQLAENIESMIRESGEPTSLIGVEIGPFVLTREIARGGMGQVFEARRRDDDFEQTVAIKLLPGHRLNVEARLRFAIERRVLARLKHPNIAQLIDGGTLDDGMPYIVMEYVDGIAIDRYCRENKLSNRAILELILKVCSAVQLAHRNLVVHRDIKPGNVLVDASGEPKLLDFGIAKLLDQDGTESGERTRTGLRMLTPAYASPEQVEGREITTAVDVYALGLLTYQLLTDRLPYRAEPRDQQSMERLILSTPAEAPSDALISREHELDLDRPPEWRRHQRRALRGDLDTILLTALRKEPERRYSNVAALADDLQRHLDKRPIQARPDRLAYRLGLLLKRHPVAAPVATLAVTLALVAGAVFTWMLAEERDQARAAEARASQTAQFAASLLSSTSAQNDGDRLVPVTELLDTASQRVAEELSEEPLVALPLHLALGDAHMSWGSYERAVDEARAALALAEDTGSRPEQALAFDLLARLSHDMGDVDEALRLTQQSFEIMRETANSEERGWLLVRMAVSLNDAGHRLDALPVFAEAELALRELQGETHPDLPWLMNNYGWCLHALGRWDEAMERYNWAIETLDRQDGPPFDRALTLSNRAGLLRDTGRPEAAEPDLRRALGLLQGMFGDEGHVGVARGHHLLAAGLAELGRMDEALEHSRLAVEMNLELLGSNHRWVGYSLNGRASIHLALGQLEAAARDIEAAAGIVEAQQGPDHLDHVEVLLLGGRLAAAQDDAETAIARLRRAQDIAKPRANVERTPIDQVEWQLALLLAGQGDPEGTSLAQSVIDRLDEKLDASDWRLGIKRAELQLPPFEANPDADQVRRARALVAELSDRFSARSPHLRGLSEALDRLPGS